MGASKLMKKPDFQQLLEGLMIVDMVIVRTYCWIHVMMKHFNVSLVLLWESHSLV